MRVLAGLISTLACYHTACADDVPPIRDDRPAPVIYSAPANPFDLYPYTLTFGTIETSATSYRVCERYSCQQSRTGETVCGYAVCTDPIRNFGHDENIERQYIEHVIELQRMRQ